MVHSTLDQLAIITYAFIDAGADIKAYNRELSGKIIQLGNVLTSKGYSDSFLVDAFHELNYDDNRGCITSLASEFEHILKNRLKQLKLHVNEKDSLGKILNYGYIIKVLRKEDVGILKDIASNRNKKRSAWRH